MKNIMVVTESNSVWGAERSLLTLARYAESNNVALHFLIADESPLSLELERLALPYTRHKFADHPALSSGGSLSGAGIRVFLGEIRSVISGALGMWRKLRGFDSVLVFSIWQAPETILGSWLARIPVDIDLHETFGNSRAMKLVGLISRASRRVIVPSAILASRSGLKPSRRLSVIPRPVDYMPTVLSLDRFGPESPMTVGVFGQIQPHKNILEIADQIVSAGVPVRFVVVGGNAVQADRSEYELEVRRLVSSMAYESTVLNFVTDVTALMAECEVVINASEHEAFGRTIVEAVSVGCYPISVGDWGPKETINALGVGSAIDSIGDLRALLIDLSVARRKEPLMRSVPPSISAYETSAVAHRYFSLISSVLAK